MRIYIHLVCTFAVWCFLSASAVLCLLCPLWICVKLNHMNFTCMQWNFVPRGSSDESSLESSDTFTSNHRALHSCVIVWVSYKSENPFLQFMYFFITLWAIFLFSTKNLECSNHVFVTTPGLFTVIIVTGMTQWPFRLEFSATGIFSQKR